MKKRLITFISVLILLCGITLAQERPEFAPYPGGSPFPPGHEPSLTHLVQVYWTTLSGVETRIRILAEGSRPTQVQCTNESGEKRETVFATIAPDCDYTIRITARKEAEPTWVAEGHGNLTVRVFGFNKRDFKSPPIVSAAYFRNGRLIGKTEIIAAPAPERKNHD